jgi:hypothetical protein
MIHRLPEAERPLASHIGVQHLPGVGRNFQDHFMVASCMWEFADPLPPCNNFGEAVAFWKTYSSLEAPDIHIAHVTRRARPRRELTHKEFPDDPRSNQDRKRRRDPDDQ